MPLDLLPPSTSNADFFLEHAHPGTLGLLAARAPLRPLPDLIRLFTGSKFLDGPGEPSLWSHAFLVTHRHEAADGRVEVHIVESTLVPTHHRQDPDAPGDPDWDGPQRSMLVAREADGSILAQPRRTPVRRYAHDRFTPNVALYDLGVQGPDLHRLVHRAQASLAAHRNYGTLELVGILLGALDGDTIEPIPGDCADDLFCSAYLREILDEFVPAIGDIPHAHSHTTCEHIYRALEDAGHPGRAIIRHGDLPPDAGSDLDLESLVEGFRRAAEHREVRRRAAVGTEDPLTEEVSTVGAPGSGAPVDPDASGA